MSEIQMFTTMSSTTPVLRRRRRHRYFRSRKQPRVFLGVSRQEKLKRARQLLESHEGEEQPLRIEAATTSTGAGGEGGTSLIPVSLAPSVEGGPSTIKGPVTHAGVDVRPSMILASTTRSGEVQTSRTEPPAGLHSRGRAIAGPSASQGGATPLETASSRKLSSQRESLSPVGAIYVPDLE